VKHTGIDGQLALLADPIDTAFFDFHRDHPEVYEALRNLAFEWKAAGHDRIGIATLYEVLRWQRGLAGLVDDDGFRLNNNFRSRYARLLMSNEPELVGMFDTRTIRPDREQVPA